MLRLIKGGSESRSASPAGATDSEDDERSDSDIWTGDWRLGVSEIDFELPNAGTGADPLALSDLAADPRNDAVVLFLLRDYRSKSCRAQVEDVADRYGEFRDRDAAAVAVLPEPCERAEKWQKKYHLPFGLVADEDKTVGEHYGQPTRWGKLGGLHDLLGRLPAAAILDARGELDVWAVHRGDGPDDRPEVDEVLAMVDRLFERRPSDRLRDAR
ncbi:MULTISPECIES: peroxiredoxin family protein [Halorussus]|uniref:peroxiredoxin family protein n=1 Tax=Halorussus TaxID=1070314 RepID=UPI00209E0FD8|nr:redoxin domain-containing protein [Halorussus vallis]USZ77694.1 redoxin domain-containing protein [Halorussus vallis]